MVFPKQEGHVPNFGELQAPKRDMGGVPYEKKTPREHQQEAVKDIVNALNVPGDDVRTQAHMACGTGKTMVALWVAEKLKAQKTLLVEPSLALIAQNLKEWQANASGPPPEVLVICSDQTVVKPNEDEVKIDIRDIPARVTSNPEEVAQFLKSGSERKIVISTYHSLPVLGEAMKVQGTGRFDIAIADEAHRTASKEDGAFTLFHYQEVVPSRLRLYLTATPKIYEGESEQKISMDDESIFGKVSHSLPFSKAIELKLLSDYRLVVATLPNNYLEESKKQSPHEKKEAIKQLAVLKAIDKFKLSKVLSFHSTVDRAYKFAESVQETGPKYLSNRAIWAYGVDGRMPSSTRSDLLKLLAEQSKKTLSLISNCRCLTEGIDVPAIDGVIFFDPKKSGVDIVQAIGRAIRQSTATEKEYGTIVVPLVVPANIESADFLESSEFKHVAQVMRALRAHDDRFEVRIKEIIAGEGFGNVGNGRVSELVNFDVEGLTQSFVESLSVKVLKIGAGINGVPLKEEVIVAAAIQHYEKTGELPTCADSTSEIPLLPEDNWKAINMAGQKGHRNLGMGRTIAEILKPIKVKYGSRVKGCPLIEEEIIKAAIEHYKETGEWPTCNDLTSKIPRLPLDNWTAISAAGQIGIRNLEKGRTLAVILKPIKEQYGSKVMGGTLTEEKIIEAAFEQFKDTGKWPTNKDSESKIPLLPGDNWTAINQAGQSGLRSLEKGRTLAKILEPTKLLHGSKVKGSLLIEEEIIKAAIEHFDKTGKWPTCADSTSKIPLLPGDTWAAINDAGRGGFRNLEKGRTLAVILNPIKVKYGSKVITQGGTLIVEKIIKAAIQHFDKTGNWPTSADSQSEIPLLPGDNWSAINSAGKNGGRSLEKGRTLSKILEPIKVKYGYKVKAKGGQLTVEKIIKAAIEHFDKTRKWPTCDDSESKIPLLPEDNWNAINSAGHRGCRGLEKGLTLAKILEPIKERYGFKVRGVGGSLIEEDIIKAAIEHFDKTRKWPTCDDSESEIPLLPGDNWTAINAAGQTGCRTLEKGQTLSKILKPIKERYAKG